MQREGLHGMLHVCALLGRVHRPLLWSGLGRTLSMMEASIVLMVTGGSLMPSTQEPSQGAGQTRPVNSGKLLVSSSRNSASFQRPWCTSAFHSGILFPRGHPTPHSWLSA